MLCRVADDTIFIASSDGEASFSFARSEFAHIASLCADEASQSVVVTAAKNASDLADVMANKRGNYRAYRTTGSGSIQLTDEYTNTAVPLPDGSIAYSNGANLVVRSGSERRTWKTGKFNWGPVAISCNADATVIAMTKWAGDNRKLFTIDRKSGIATTSTFSYYSYVLDDRFVYYALGGGVKRLSLESGETDTLTGAAFSKALRALFGGAEPPGSSVRTDIHSITLFHGRLLASVWQYVFRGNDVITLARAVVSWTPAQTDIRIEQNVGDSGMVDALVSNGETALVTIASPVGLPPHVYRRCAFGRSAALIDAGWNMIDVPSLPNHGFLFLPGAENEA